MSEVLYIEKLLEWYNSKDDIKLDDVLIIKLLELGGFKAERVKDVYVLYDFQREKYDTDQETVWQHFLPENVCSEVEKSVISTYKTLDEILSRLWVPYMVDVFKVLKEDYKED